MPKNKQSYYKTAFDFLFFYIKPHKVWYAIPMIISLILIGVNLLQVYVTKNLMDNSINGNIDKLMMSITAFLIIVIVNVALSWAMQMSSGKLSALCTRDMKNNIADKLIDAQYTEVINLKTGDTLNTLNDDTDTVASFISGSLISVFAKLAMAGVMFLYLLVISPKIAIITFCYTPLGMFFTMSLNKKLRLLHPQNADYKGEALSAAEQTLSCIPVIKSFVMEKKIADKIKEAYGNVYKKDMEIAVFNALMQPACFSLSKVPVLTYLIFAGRMVIAGDLSAGQFVAIYSMLEFIISPSVYFPFMINGINRSIASINRIRTISNLIEDSKKEMIPASVCHPVVKVRNLSFCHNKDNPIFTDFSFEIDNKGIILIKGESGRGKTTLLDLLSGLYTPQGGTIEVCGINPAITDVSGILSAVSQDTYIYPISIRENIRLSRPKAEDDEVEEAAKLAGAHEFISKMDRGYDTLIGDGNTGLSGGQKQRIALAQAILKNAPIWILDEPTSALDMETETIIIQSIRRFSKEKIIILSAHRQSLIDIADGVIDLDVREGQVAI